jgi:hypothetical protein
MALIERPPAHVAPQHIGLAITTTLATCVLFDLIIVARAQASQVAQRIKSTVASAFDVIDASGPRATAWDDARVVVAS